MMEQVRSWKQREDGFVEVQLKRIRDFDDYLYQQLMADPTCLSCVRDPKSKTRLYFDSKECISLRAYLAAHVFARWELLDFLIYLLEGIVHIHAAKPLFYSVDTLFLSLADGSLRFLIVPVVCAYWKQEQPVTTAFLQELLEQLQTDSYEVLGCLLWGQKQPRPSLTGILPKLHDLKQQQTHKLSFWQRLRHKESPAVYQVQGLPRLSRMPDSAKRMEIAEEPSFYMEKEKQQAGKYVSGKEACQRSLPDAKAVVEKEAEGKTMILFPVDTSAALVDAVSGERLALTDKLVTIGRSPDNELCIHDPTVSSYHASLDVTQGMIKDLHSLNGTYVNEQQVFQQTLQDGDRIRFGKAAYIFQLGQDRK